LSWWGRRILHFFPSFIALSFGHLLWPLLDKFSTELVEPTSLTSSMLPGWFGTELVTEPVEGLLQEV